ncbi:KAP family P-loop NTPase fold protein [Paenibacillus wynnii]|uniref:KAP family P-loop NTPase fold protein n=1 Tax=Paenibacillus wynnii TaxID=268407 RepID=UPI00279331BD|nr:P-loop NTPase fold protein [Paenibacillus wynnii]MDQ0194910.1 hypothetical protein [Paenibacillus wynnii]
MDDRKERRRILSDELEELKTQLSNEYYEQHGNSHEIDYDEHLDPDYKINDLQNKIDKHEKEIRRIEIEQENEEKKNIFDGFPRNNGFMITDIESEIDLLSRTPQAETISRFIANKETNPPLTIGVYGPWGAGKSTFLRLVEKQLVIINQEIDDKREEVYKKYNKTHLIRFNPTEYEDQNMIWYAILKELYLKYDADMGFKGRVAYSFRRLIPSFRKNKVPYVTSLILIILNAILFYIYFNQLNQYSTILNIIKNSNIFINLLTIVVSITAIFQVIIPFFKKIQILFKPVSAKMIQHVLIPNYKAKLGTREEVKESLDDLLKVWIKDNEKIVMFVDELDRCSEKTIVEFFSALQLFLSFNSLIHVISMNEEIVALALAKNNDFYFQDNTTKKEKLDFGYKYLQKYVTTAFHLPVERSYMNFLNELLNPQNEFFKEEEKNTVVSMIGDIAKDKEITPRELKKIINLLILSKERLVAERFPYNLTSVDFIKWFLVDYFNPLGTRYFITKLKSGENYEEHKFKFFNDVYPSLIPARDEEDRGEKTIHYLMKYLDIRIEVILIADNVIESSFIRE